GGTEGDRVREGDVEVVDEVWPPAGLGELGVLQLRELEVGRRQVGLQPAYRAAAVEAPVPEAEGDHVRAPDRDRLQQQLRAALLVALHERTDQRDQEQRVGQADHAEQREGDGATMAELFELPA